jgi:predicted phage terminase large subunit-like protein
MLMTGTILARISVLGLLIKHINDRAEEFVQKYGVRNMRAAVHSIITPEGLPLWPENFSLEEIGRIRDTVGSVIFASEYMNSPIDDGVIKEEWIRYVEPEALAGRPLAYFSGSDPSARHGENNDYKATIVVARDQESKLLTVAHAWIRRASIGEMDQEFINRYREFKMLAGGFETNGFQMVVKEDLEKRCQAEGLYPPIVSVEHRTDKLLRMGRLGPLIERGVLRFIKGHSDQDLLVEQLLALGGNEKDDGPDGLEMAVAMAERGTAEFKYHPAHRRRIGAIARQEGYFA